MRTLLASAAALLFSVSLASACTWGASHTADGGKSMSEESVMSTYDGAHLPPIQETDEATAAVTTECAEGDADCKVAE